MRARFRALRSTSRRERGSVEDRAAVFRIAQSNGEFGKLLASAGEDREVILFDTTVREGRRSET